MLTDRSGSVLRLGSSVLLAGCLWLASCGSRSPLRDLDADRDASVPPDAAKVPLDAAGVDAAGVDAPPPPGCFGAGETILATDEIAAAIAIDETHVYWASAGINCGEGRIRSMPTAGGPITTLADQLPNPRAIALDANRVYFYNACGSGELRSVAKQGGPVLDHPIFVDTTDDGRVIAVDSNNIYFNDYGVLGVPKIGGPQFEVDNLDYVYGLAADDAGVHWIGPIGGGSEYGIFAWHLGDPGPTLLAKPTSVGGGIAIDQSSIYFAGGIGILHISRTGGPLTTLIAATPWRVAIDETHVYWSEGFSGSGGHWIKKVPKIGGIETLIASGDGAYVDLAVDDRCVYWADLYGQQIGRTPK